MDDQKREPFITPELESILQNIFREKCQQFGVEMLAFGNVEDHVHLLLSMNPNIKITDFVAGAKGASSHYINHEVGKQLYWQDGYGCFSIGRSELEQAKAYVFNQKKHHSERTMVNELEDS